MTKDDIDTLITAMLADAARGEAGAAPGAIYLRDTSWIRLGPELNTTCRAAAHGIRYRGVRVLISRHFDDRVATRDECGEAGQPFEDTASA